MKKKISVFALVLSLSLFSLKSNFLVWAQAVNCNDTEKLSIEQISTCLNQLKEAKEQSEKATKPTEEQLNAILKQINGIKARVGIIDQDLIAKKKSIDDGYKNLAKQQIILNRTIADYYIKSYYFSPILIFLSSTNASDLTRLLAYQRVVTNNDKVKITNIALAIQDLENRKLRLEQEQQRLTVIKTDLDVQSAKLDKIVAEAKNYQSKLSGQIAQLSARQQEIVNSRSGNFTVSIGDSELADDYNASIKGFRESAPSGYFGVFSFGAYTHRNGMSQYGALGRSSSKEPEEILSFYYPGKELKKDYSEPSTIHVKGPGTSCSGEAKNYDEDVDFQTYMKSIWEVPASWPDKVLKAQAVAARSYAINRMNGAGYIVPNEGAGGQVYKDCQKEGGWPSAVESTKGWVLTSGGTAAFTEFSSTTGGWINGVGWDTTDGNGGSNFIDKAYEKVGGSPWLYKAWYTERYSINSDKCGRSTPWLSPQEMADIVNAVIALKTVGIDTSRITPVTTSCWGGNPYSMDELKNLVSGNGGISSANSVSVSQGNGTTNSVTINGVNLSGAEFKKAFNLRAPGRLSIPQSGFAFFNIERK